MKFKSLLAIGLVFFTIIVNAQHYHISGRITNTNAAGVTGAVILAKQEADSTLLKTAVVNEQGYYTIDFTSPRPALLKVDAPGYESRSRPVLPTDTIVNLVLNTSVSALGGVTVSARKQLLEHRIDRTIFNVSASISAAGGNAYDAVKKAPAVIVREGDNSITIAGKSSAQVMLNGRLLQLSGEDLTAYLQAIASDNIDRIEVITTPPAQYDAVGNSGLINIVLKKNNAAGFNGSARLGYEQSSLGTIIGGATANYRKAKLNLYGNASYAAGAKYNIERLTTYLPAQEYRLVDPYRKQTSNLQYTVGADYELNKKQVLGLQFNSTLFKRNDNGNTDVYIARRSTGDIDSVGRTINDAARDRQTHILNLNYVWTIDTTGKKLTLNANRLWYADDRARNFETTNYNGLFQSPTGVAEKNRNEGARQVAITTVQADAELPYKWASLSLGGKLSFVDNYSSNNFSTYTNNTWVNNPAISNAFRYREAVQALYISAQKDISKWSFQAGLRAEATQAEGYSPTLNQTNTSSYVNVFPTAYTTYKFSDAHIIGLTYNKRINRPGYADLNPFRIYSSPYLYAEGNPYLRPSYDHTISLEYTLKQKFTFSGYYEHEVWHFGLVFGIDSVTKASYTAISNFGNFSAYGLSATASLAPVKWWELQAFATGGVQQVRTTTTVSNQAQSYTLPSAYLSANNSFTLNKKRTLLAELNVYYVSRQQQDLFYVNASASVDTGIKAVFLDKKLVVNLSATDIFGTQRYRSVNQVTGQTLDSYFDQQSLRLMLNYKFGSDKVRAHRERATGVEDERNRT